MTNWRLIITVAVTTAGASFQFYSFGAINTPQTIVEAWMNETYARRLGYSLSAATLTFLWSCTVGSAAFGAILGSIATRILAESCGRKLSLIINGFITILGGVLEGSCKLVSSPEIFIIGRFLLGFSNGISTGMVPLFLTEIATVEKRGAAGAAHQIVVAFADWFSLFITLPRILGSERLWPLAFAFAAIPAIPMVLVLPFTKESPRYLLITKRDRSGAEKAVRFYTRSEQEFLSMFDGLLKEAAASSMAQSEKEAHWKDFIYKRELRLPVLISFMVMTAQQFTGCAAVFSYSTNMFMQAELSKDVAELSTLAIGIGYFVFTLPSPYFIEKFGRRKLSIFQLSACLVFLIVLTVFIALNNKYDQDWASYGAIGALVVYMCVYGVGSSVPWIITTELYEQEYRSFGVSIGTFFAWFWALIISMGYYPFQRAVGIEFSFLPFIIVTAFSIAGMAWLLPETKNKTIDEIVKEFRKRKASASISHFVPQLSRQDGKHPELAALLEETGDDEEGHRNYHSIRSG